MLQLPVTYKGEEQEYPLTVAAAGYATRYLVDVDGTTVVYEYDDSGELRAIINELYLPGARPPERELLEAIGAVLKTVLA